MTENKLTLWDILNLVNQALRPAIRDTSMYIMPDIDLLRAARGGVTVAMSMLSEGLDAEEVTEALRELVTDAE